MELDSSGWDISNEQEKRKRKKGKSQSTTMPSHTQERENKKTAPDTRAGLLNRS
jgi:hypothetical protein